MSNEELKTRFIELRAELEGERAAAKLVADALLPWLERGKELYAEIDKYQDRMSDIIKRLDQAVDEFCDRQDIDQADWWKGE